MRLSFFFLLLITSGLLSIYYFLLLTIGISNGLLSLLLSLASIGAIVFLFKKDLKILLKEQLEPKSFTIWFFALVVFGSLILDIMTVEGRWDAWAMWNLHARMLMDDEMWIVALQNKNMIWNSPDYPLHLPGIIASVWSLLNIKPDIIIPMLVCIYFSLLTLSITYFAIDKKNIWVGCLIVFYFLSHKNIIDLFASQFADLLVACLYLAIFVAWDKYKEQKLGWWAFCAGFMLALSLWTKNEAAIFVALLLIFNIFSVQKKDILKLIIGFGIPLFAYLIFKLGFAPNGYMNKQTSLDKFDNIFDAERYHIVFTFFIETVYERYQSMFAFTVICIAHILRFKKLPINSIVIVAVLAAYLFVYIYYDFPLQWQLETSLPRLLLQIEISMLYISGVMLINILNQKNAFEVEKNDRLIHQIHQKMS